MGKCSEYFVYDCNQFTLLSIFAAIEIVQSIPGYILYYMMMFPRFSSILENFIVYFNCIGYSFGNLKHEGPERESNWSKNTKMGGATLEKRHSFKSKFHEKRLIRIFSTEKSLKLVEN